jgi:peptidoglycan/LPS O-acetylase OafA/YrhL
MCYSLYLLHYPLISFLGRLCSRFALGREFWSNYLLQSVLVLPALLAVCAAFFLLVEKPCMRPDWPGRLWARLRAAVLGPAQLGGEPR